MIVNKTNDYVLYQSKDCAGVFRRIIAACIDLIVLSIATAFFNYIFIRASIISSQEGEAHFGFLLFRTFIWFVYFVLLKRSSFKTVGYILTKIKIVNLKGRQPSIFSMSLRAGIRFFGLFLNVFDVLFLAGEKQNQTIADKFVGTYVVKNNVTPISGGIKKHELFSFMGSYMMLTPVIRPSSTE